jgi:hypothetical protein
MVYQTRQVAEDARNVLASKFDIRTRVVSFTGFILPDGEVVGQ